MNNGIKIAMGIGLVMVLTLFVIFGAQYMGDTFKTMCSQENPLDFTKCDKQFDTAFTVFAIIIGLIALTVGLKIKHNNTLSGGLVGGGIVSLIMAVINYWSNLNAVVRVGAIGVLALMLIFIAYKKLRD